jgi:putative ABC transport system permease protein
VGARPGQVFALIVGEAFALTAAGVALGLAGLYAALAIGAPLVEARFGLHLAWAAPSGYELALIGGVLLGSLVLGMVPAYRAYRYSLADGLSIRF